MNNNRKLHLRLWLLVLGFFLLGLLLMQLASCASTRIVEREVVRTQHDTLRLIDRQRDSIFHRDSVYLVERWMGDTLIREKTREIVRYHDRVKRDTIYKVVRHESTTQKTQERLKPWWGRAFGGLRVVLVAVVCLLLGIFVGKYILRLL